MLCSGLSSTLLLGAAYFLLTSGFSRAQLSLPSNVTAISTGRVITFNVISVLQLSCGSGVMIVQSVLYRCADKEICSRLHDLDVIKKSCDLKEVCEINTNMVRTCDPSVCTYLDITFNCFPAIHSVTCEGSQAKLQCGEGQVIVVYWANYGRRDNTTCPDGNTAQLQNVTCLSPGSPEYVTNRCNWQNSCTVEAKSSVFGDPCVGTYKYLEVVYDCQESEATSSPPPTTVTEVHSVTCEGSQAKLQCGEGQVIVVSWANFGRRDNTTCSDGRANSQLQNVNCSSPNSTEYVTNRCNWQNSCTVEAKSSVFGDPCVGTYKYLEVVYDCQAGSSKTCPPGWTWFGGRCFIFNSSQKNWTDAESSCETLGGHLASFHNTAEYTFIRELTHTAAGSYKEAWVGGRKNETVWMWSDGSQFDFINWASGEPNNYGGGEDCMEINHGERDYVNDKKCNTNIPFVCVRDP
ncbi:L-rhamnose-binding lectin CSL1-like isoform X3 [Oreochromis aureus]|uniref:L-rhamnose-binding lectin CSL1-like isoform X3 n=1 Tax=Oreochromis aureus TaxID=47969 RepID=UPI0019540E8A|nr:L-rhamnose-binding lectin CSL1-like isoform X3 [Oreochromis aureus]